ncbi:MAG: hypothetical protein ACIALR_00735 [Blastopirellula sp. JB062]
MMVSGVAAIGMVTKSPEGARQNNSTQAVAAVMQSDQIEIRQKIFYEQVLPSIEEADQVNREAAERCVARVVESFAGYRAGITHFAEDVTSLGTRFGVVARMPKDWLYQNGSVRLLIAGKLAKHVISAEALQHDIESSLSIFQQDLEANRGKMLSQIQSASGDLAIPELQQLDVDTLSKEIISQLQNASAENAARDATVFVVTEVGLVVTGSVIEQMFAAIAVRLGSAAGGATVGGAAVGGGGGLAAGPIGSGVGIAGGIVVGLVIDYWLTESTKATLTQQLNGLLDQIETAVLDGVAVEEPEGELSPGLKSMLQNSCDQLQRAYQESLRQRMLGESA